MNMALTRLLQLTSPTLPVGAYAYSQGAESAVYKGLVSDVDSVKNWLEGCLLHGQVYGDLALLNYFYQAWRECDARSHEALSVISARSKLKSLAILSAAIRETAELLQEDQHMALALMRLAQPLDVELQLDSDVPKTYPMLFARFAVSWNISVEETIQGYAWSWLENQLAAMVKLVPLGQTQGQQLMLSFDDLIQQAVKKALLVEEDEIGSSLPMLAILSSQHETQYSRLFRS